MTLLLTLVLVTASLTALFWAMSLILQPYLYSEPADRLGLRALVGGLILGVYLTGWAYINTRASHHGKYDTLLEFTPTDTRTIDEFEAVHRLNRKADDGTWVEENVAFVRQPGVTGRFVEAGDPTQTFQVNGSRGGVQFMTVALMVGGPDGGDPARFDANLSDDGATYRTRSEDVVFTQVGGSRYVESRVPGVVYAPSLLAVIIAILLNVIHLLLWFVVFWPVMRYSSGAALGLAAGFGLIAMVTFVPLLFEENRVDPIPAVQTS